jgi:oxygen-dependent protoporphyrinogen oxidase
VAKPRIVIIGGGITGLTAAYTLDQEGDCEVILLEAGPRLGGKIATQRIPWHDSTLVVEEGADALFSRKPWALDLAEELGLAHELVEPQAKEFSMLIDGKLHRVPAGLVTLTYSDTDAIDRADFLSNEAKASVAREAHVPKGEGDDESIASFFRRRFGEEFSRVIAEPLLAGTHGGSPETLSMKALYPAYFDLEREHGSLAAGTANHKPTPPPTGIRGNTFLSFRNGMGTLVETLSTRLGKTQTHLNTPVAKISGPPTLFLEGESEKGRGANQTSAKQLLTVTTDDGREWVANDVILAVPSHQAAKLVAESAPKAANLMANIKHASGAIVTLAYPADAIPGGISGTGFLVPYHEDFPLTGGTWSSVKWPNRAPSDTILVRLFLGRSEGLNLETETEETIVKIAQNAFERLCTAKQSPIFRTMQRWIQSLPQYEVGHLECLVGIDAALTPLRGLHLAGTSYRGVGIPDCVRQGREVARSVLRKSIYNHE